MRRTLLVILAFAPAVAAVIIFRTWSDENPARVRTARNESRRDDGQRGGVNAATAGTETFFTRMGTATIDGEEVDYRSAYYYLASWRRTDDERFEAENTLIVINPRPQSAADLEKLLVIRASQDTVRRRARLRAAAKEYTSLESDRADITGGTSVETATAISFEGEVSGQVVDASRTAQPILFEAPEALLSLDRGRVVKVELPQNFFVAGEDFEMRGRDLVADDQATLIIEKEVDLGLGASGDEASPWRATLRSSGRFEYRPDAGESELSALDRIRLDGGEIIAEEDVVLVLGGITFKADRLEARIAPREDGRAEGASRRTRLERLILSGDVRITTPDGEASGSHAVVDVGEGDAIDATIEGSPVVVSWRAARGLGADDHERLVMASARKRVRLLRPGRDVLDQPMVISLHDAANVLVKQDQETRLDLDADTIEVRATRLRTPDARDDETVYRVTHVEAEGGVAGLSGRSRFRGRDAEFRRIHAPSGHHLYDVVVLTKDIDIVLEGGDAESDRTTRLEAAERLEMKRPTSSAEPTRLAASEDVVVSWEKSGALTERLEASSLEATLGTRSEPRESGEPRTTQVLETFAARGDVALRRPEGAEVDAEEILFDRSKDEILVTGTPAVFDYPEKDGRRHRFAAPHVRILREAGRVMASGGVEADATLPALVLTAAQREAEEEADRELDERPSRDVRWRVRAEDARCTFTGGLPLDRRESESRLREVELLGGVRMENPTQTISADRMFYDLVARSGRGRGTPVVATTRREVDGGAWTDRIEAPEVTTNKNWTLFHGPCSALLHVRPSEGEGLERLEARCAGDVVMKDSLVTFNGRTHAERGPQNAPTLTLDADSVATSFKPGVRPGTPGSLERLTALGKVEFSRGQLSGSGDEAQFDETRRKIIVRSTTGKCRMVLRGFTTTNEMVTYDMDTETITGTRLSGRGKRTP